LNSEILIFTPLTSILSPLKRGEEGGINKFNSYLFDIDDDLVGYGILEMTRILFDIDRTIVILCFTHNGDVSGGFFGLICQRF
jgi:hypothetical protein